MNQRVSGFRVVFRFRFRFRFVVSFLQIHFYVTRGRRPLISVWMKVQIEVLMIRIKPISLIN